MIAALVLFFSPEPARGLPVFAHRFGFSCQKCHSTVPKLNEFGEGFKMAGFRLPDSSMHSTVPIAVKTIVNYTTARDPDEHLPKAIVDEIELLSGGSIGKHFSYFLEDYAVDGGKPGLPRDVWLGYEVVAPQREFAAQLTAGQFTLPLPVEPESFRDTINHYAVFDQRIGANPFNFFDPRIGLDASISLSDLKADIAVLKGHDRQSGLPSFGADRMIAVADRVGSFELSTYHYAGTRPIQPTSDGFWRQGFAASWTDGRAQLEALVQTGIDSSLDGTARGQFSSGGFGQLRLDLSPTLFAVVRHEGTNGDVGMSRSTTVTLVRRLRPNMRFTLEDVIVGNPRSHKLNASWLFAY